MDVNKGLLYSGNNEKVYQKCLIDFYQDSQRRREPFAAMAEQNLQSYRLEAHALKGIARNIGAIRLSEMAYLHEEAASEGNEGYIKETLPRLMELWAQVLADIEAYVGTEALGDELAKLEKDGVVLVSSEVCAAAKLCILHLTRYEEDEALSVLKKVLAHELPPETRDIFEKAYREVDDFEYDSAAAILKEISEA